MPVKPKAKESKSLVKEQVADHNSTEVAEKQKKTKEKKKDLKRKERKNDGDEV